MLNSFLFKRIVSVLLKNYKFKNDVLNSLLFYSDIYLSINYENTRLTIKNETLEKPVRNSLCLFFHLFLVPCNSVKKKFIAKSSKKTHLKKTKFNLQTIKLTRYRLSMKSHPLCFLHFYPAKAK